jgi:predicted membrane chloride channel (bestrophin family)
VTLLSTFRTNQSLARLLEARLAWGRTILLARDTAQLLNAHVYSSSPPLGLMAARHLCLFGFLLKARLRDEPDADLISALLPPADAAYVQSQRKHPVALLDRLYQIVSAEGRAGRINVAAQRSLEANFLELNRVYGMCERLRMSPIPPMCELFCEGGGGVGGGGGSMMTYKTDVRATIMRVAGSATSAMRKPQTTKRVRNDEA